MYTVGNGIWQETDKEENWEKYLVGPGIQRETLKIVKNEKCTQKDLKYGVKIQKCGKWVAHTLGPWICPQKWQMMKMRKPW